MLIETVVVGELATNCYVVADAEGGSALVIDPADEADRILLVIERLEVAVKAIVNTHGHPDHVGANALAAAKTGAPIGIHEADAYMLRDGVVSMALYAGYDLTLVEPDFLLTDGQILTAGNLSFTVRHTPGHTPGSVCLRCGSALFTGDLVFKESVGRTDFPGGSYAALIHSIRDNVLTLPDDVVIYPGHGPSTTVGWERQHNPYLGLAT